MHPIVFETPSRYFDQTVFFLVASFLVNPDLSHPTSMKAGAAAMRLKSHDRWPYSSGTRKYEENKEKFLQDSGRPSKEVRQVKGDNAGEGV